MSLEKLTKANRDGTCSIGKNVVVKKLREGKVQEVYVSASCPGKMQAELENSAKLANVNVVKLPESSEEVGAALGKPFSITVAAVLSK